MPSDSLILLHERNKITDKTTQQQHFDQSHCYSLFEKYTSFNFNKAKVQ